MFANLAADLGLLRDDHGLKGDWIAMELKTADQIAHPVVLEGDLAEGGIQFVECVPNLVHGHVLGTRELAIRHCVLFQEVANLIAGLEKVRVTDVAVPSLVACCESGQGVVLKLEILQQGFGSREEGLHVARRDEASEDKISRCDSIRG